MALSGFLRTVLLFSLGGWIALASTGDDSAVVRNGQQATLRRESVGPQPQASGSLSFSYQIGGSAPPAQQFSETLSGSATVAFTARSDQSWATVSPASGNITGGTAMSFTVSVNPGSLGVGTYNATI